MVQNCPGEALLTAQRRLEGLELAKADHLRNSVSGAPRTDGRELQFPLIVGIGARIDQRLANMAPATVGFLHMVAHRRPVTGRVVHGPVQRRVVAGEADIGDADIGHRRASVGRLRARLGEIKVPTRIFVGEEDYATPPAMAQQMHEGIAGSTLRILAKARHLTPLEAPDDVSAEIMGVVRAVQG